MEYSQNSRRRLIEDWLPVNELSIEAIRERAGAVPNPAVHQLHVWWARRPLVCSRAAVAASLLSADCDHDQFRAVIGTHHSVVEEHKKLEAAKAQRIRLKTGYSRRRSFMHNLTADEAQWIRDG